MRFVRRDVRDLIAHQKNGHGASYRRPLSRDFRCRPIFDFCSTIPSKAEIGAVTDKRPNLPKQVCVETRHMRAVLKAQINKTLAFLWLAPAKNAC